MISHHSPIARHRRARRRKEAQRRADNCIIFLVAAGAVAGVMYVAGKVDIRYLQLVNPWICYGLALASAGLGVAAIYGWLVNFGRARF